MVPRFVSNRNLFSETYLSGRLRLSFDAVEQESRAAFAKLKTLYDAAKPHRFADGKEKVLREEFLDRALTLLGWHYSSEGSIPGAGFPDYTLFLNEDDKQSALSKGEGLEFFRHAVAICEAKPWAFPLFSKVEGEKQSPRGQVYGYLESTHCRWGFVTSGKEWALVCRDYSRAQQRDYTIDLQELLKRPEWSADFNFFYLFFRREGIADGFLARALDESRISGESVGKDLKQNVFTALRILGEALKNERPELFESDEGLKTAKENCLVLLYRLLFISYAESRGLLPMGEGEFYRKSTSLLRVKESVKDAAPAMSGEEYAKIDPTKNHYLRNIRKVFHVIDKGLAAGGVPPYNGGLFRAEENPFLEKLDLDDRSVARVVDLLSRSQRDPERFLDYSYLGVRELGSIYEGLLEFSFRVAGEDLISVRGDRRTEEVWKPESKASAKELEQATERIARGTVYLATGKGERKVTGSYYTPHRVVMRIVRETLGPVVERRVEEAKRSGSDAELAILGIKVLDPAMGSGHFLVAATEFLAERLIDAVETKLGSPSEGEELESWAKRQVVSHCIYGVDLNPMAVELAKVSLWLTTFSRDHPLSFLDHRLKNGNSLVGAFVPELPIFPAELFKGKVRRAVADRRQQRFETSDLVERFNRGIQQIEAIPDDTLAGVEKKKLLYSKLTTMEEYLTIRQLAHAYVSLFFNSELKDPETPKYWDRLVAAVMSGDSKAARGKLGLDWVRDGVRLATSKMAFHWDLEFPEVFSRGRGGFDAVIGNPPYVRIYRGALSEEDTAFFQRRFEAAHMKFDLYLLFMELGLKLIRPGGRLGLIVPDKFATSPYGEPLRKQILANHLVSIDDLRGRQVFPGVGVENLIPIIEKADANVSPNRKTRVFRPRSQESETDDLVAISETVQIAFQKFPQFQIRIGADFELMHLLEKMQANSFPLKKAFYVNWGLRTGTDEKTDRMITETPQGNAKPLLRGEDIIEKYVLNHPKRFIDYDPSQLYNPMFPELFERPKLVFRKISGPEGLMAVCDEEAWYCFSTLICAINLTELRGIKRVGVTAPGPEAEAFRDPYVALAIANSRTVAWWYRQTFSDELGVNPNHVNAIPLPTKGLGKKAEKSLQTLGKDGRRLQQIGIQIAKEKRGFYDWLAREFGFNWHGANGRTTMKNYEDEPVESLVVVLKANKNTLSRDPSRRDSQDLFLDELSKSRDRLAILRNEQEAVSRRVDEACGELYGFTRVEIETILRPQAAKVAAAIKSQ